MQGLDDILGSSGMDLGSLAARFGLSPEQTKSAMGSLVPAVAGGFQQRAQTDSLGPVEETANGIDQPDTAGGNDILGTSSVARTSVVKLPITPLAKVAFQALC